MELTSIHSLKDYFLKKREYKTSHLQVSIVIMDKPFKDHFKKIDKDFLKIMEVVYIFLIFWNLSTNANQQLGHHFSGLKGHYLQ